MDLLTPQLRLLLHQGTAYWEVKWSISATPKLQNGLMGKAKETKLGGFSLDFVGGEIALAGAPAPLSILAVNCAYLVPTLPCRAGKACRVKGGRRV